jgi:hypothetical protein
MSNYHSETLNSGGIYSNLFFGGIHVEALVHSNVPTTKNKQIHKMKMLLIIKYLCVTFVEVLS